MLGPRAIIYFKTTAPSKRDAIGERCNCKGTERRATTLRPALCATNQDQRTLSDNAGFAGRDKNTRQGEEGGLCYPDTGSGGRVKILVGGEDRQKKTFIVKCSYYHHHNMHTNWYAY